MNSETKALLLGLIAVACWSTVATAFKIALQELSTVQLVFYANLTAVIMLAIIVAVRGDVRTLKKTFTDNWRLTIIAGLLNPVFYYLILFKAYELLPAQVAMSINYTWAIVLTLMAIVFLNQKMRLADWIAAVVCYFGVFIIATKGDLSSFADAAMLGITLALLSTVIWAGYWTLNIADKRDPIAGLTLNFLIALPISALICLLFSGFEISVRGAIAATYVGLVEMAIAFVLWSLALKLTTNASRISNLIFLSPFLSLVIINKVLGEEIFATTLVGLVLIIGGLLYQQYTHRRLDALENADIDLR